jgi:chemotaxis signal transduction protein
LTEKLIRADKNTDNPAAILLLTFRIMGTWIGVDTNQVEEILDQGKAAQRKIKVAALHEKINWGINEVTLAAPRVLMVKGGDSSIGILIDQPEDICDVKLDHLRPLPPLLAGSMAAGVVWGIALIHEEMVLLMDLDILAATAIV